MDHSAFLLLLLTGLGDDAKTPARDPFQISVNVNLVALNATVRDRRGQFVPGLREQDFEVYEDGVRQSIRLFRHEDTAVTVGLVIDHSGSMRHKLVEVIAAARTFVESSSKDDEMFVVNFNEHVALGLPGATRFTNRPAMLADAISNAPVRGMTALYDAIAKAWEQLQTGTRDRRALVVISDGGDNASARSLTEVLKMAGQSSVPIYGVGIFDDEDMDRNPQVLRHLAHATGGEAFFPNRLDELVATCVRIARDIRQQYTLGYVSSNETRPGAYRAIKVVAREPGQRKLSVRTRAGYIAEDGK